MNMELVNRLILDAKNICKAENLAPSTIKKTQYIETYFSRYRGLDALGYN
ncbi:MAG: hypothetical protein ACTSQO_06815 [Candidatus Helarchaeota archaeon]